MKYTLLSLVAMLGIAMTGMAYADEESPAQFDTTPPPAEAALPDEVMPPITLPDDGVPHS